MIEFKWSTDDDLNIKNKIVLPIINDLDDTFNASLILHCQDNKLKCAVSDTVVMYFVYSHIKHMIFNIIDDAKDIKLGYLDHMKSAFDSYMDNIKDIINGKIEND